MHFPEVHDRREVHDQRDVDGKSYVVPWSSTGFSQPRRFSWRT
jgi:hypothetical protein